MPVAIYSNKFNTLNSGVRQTETANRRTEQKLKKQHQGELGAGDERWSGSENWSLLCDLRNSAFPDGGAKGEALGVVFS